MTVELDKGFYTQLRTIGLQDWDQLAKESFEQLLQEQPRWNIPWIAFPTPVFASTLIGALTFDVGTAANAVSTAAAVIAGGFMLLTMDHDETPLPRWRSRKQATLAQRRITIEPALQLNSKEHVAPGGDIIVEVFSQNKTSLAAFNLGHEDKDVVALQVLQIRDLCQQISEENQVNRAQALAEHGVTEKGRLADPGDEKVLQAASDRRLLLLQNHDQQQQLLSREEDSQQLLNSLKD